MILVHQTLVTKLKQQSLVSLANLVHQQK